MRASPLKFNLRDALTGKVRLVDIKLNTRKISRPWKKRVKAIAPALIQHEGFEHADFKLLGYIIGAWFHYRSRNGFVYFDPERINNKLKISRTNIQEKLGYFESEGILKRLPNDGSIEFDCYELDLDTLDAWLSDEVIDA